MVAGVKTTCPYCGVGCGVIATRKSNGEVAIKGDPDHPANFGRLCSKGSALGETIDLDGRLLEPEINGAKASWDEALDKVASGFTNAINQYGPDAVAFYVSGQILTEDYYVANKLMKGFIGAANIDTNSRLCMASSVAGHKRAFGSDTVPGTYEDLELADLVVLVGSNLAWCHPVIYQRIAAAKQARPNMKVVLIDPRRTMTADLCDMHLALKPDSDVALFNGLLSHLAGAQVLDHSFIGQHTNGFDEALSAASETAGKLADVATATGLAESAIEAFYNMVAETPKTVTVYSQGVNQSSFGTNKVNAIINCHLATGRIGKPGMGPFSITGQPNAMGGRETGGLANMLAAHMDIDNAQHRDLVQKFWASPRIASKQGLKAVDMFRAVADGRIKAIWIMATNPVDSMPDADLVQAALEACPLVVVSDVLAQTDTVRHAHIKLPALAWGEKDGMVTNSERRMSRQKAFLPAPGNTRADWWQICQVAIRMGYADAFDYAGPSDIFSEYARLTTQSNEGDRDLNLGAFSGLSKADYDSFQPAQWPRSAGQENSRERFFAKGGFYHPDGKAKFIAVRPPAASKASSDNQLTLNTGRIRDHWHTMTRTGKTARLSAHIGEPFIEVHPYDADRLNLKPFSIARVLSQSEQILARVQISERQQQGSVFVPIHWTDQFAGNARICKLVPGVTDPVSGQPALKFAKVHVEPFNATHFGYAISLSRPVMDNTGYWAVAPAGFGWQTEMAFAKGDEPGLHQLGAMLDVPEGVSPTSYLDTSSKQQRHAWFQDDMLIAAAFIAPDPVSVSRGWITTQLGKTFKAVVDRMRFLAGRSGEESEDPGPIVCSCFSVGARQIAAATLSGCTSVDAIGQCLQAGTNCGSCRAEIREIINANSAIAAE